MNNFSETAAGSAAEDCEKTANSTAKDAVIFRAPEIGDGKQIWHLVKNSGVLDVNSVYCYLLLCDHFRDTCAVAELDGDVVGFVTAYILPGDTKTLFVWQVGIDAAVRGQGIARKLLLELLERDSCKNVAAIQCTISPSNKASMALFHSLARYLQADFRTNEYYGASLFPDNGHEQEDQIIIGPFKKFTR